MGTAELRGMTMSIYWISPKMYWNIAKLAGLGIFVGIYLKYFKIYGRVMEPAEGMRPHTKETREDLLSLKQSQRVSRTYLPPNYDLRTLL